MKGTASVGFVGSLLMMERLPLAAPSVVGDKVLVSAFPGAQSFVAGRAVNVQFMVKDSKRYAATGGWGFGDFKNGKPGDEALHQTCFACHVPAKDHDFVFANYAEIP